jgi:hypothetical protein
VALVYGVGPVTYAGPASWQDPLYFLGLR